MWSGRIRSARVLVSSGPEAVEITKPTLSRASAKPESPGIEYTGLASWTSSTEMDPAFIRLTIAGHAKNHVGQIGAGGHAGQDDEGERGDVLELGRKLGFLTGDETPGARAAFEKLCALVSEPLRTRGLYDFAGSDLSRRVRDHGMEVLLRERLPRPPTESLFLHRKLAGSFLLCAHIGARVDGHAIYRELVEPGPES